MRVKDPYPKEDSETKQGSNKKKGKNMHVRVSMLRSRRNLAQAGNGLTNILTKKDSSLSLSTTGGGDRENSIYDKVEPLSATKASRKRESFTPGIHSYNAA